MPAMTICQEARLRELRQRALQAAAAWDESKHPRDQAGRFGTGGGSADGNKGRRRSLLHPYHSEWSGDDAGGSRSTAGRRARNSRDRSRDHARKSPGHDERGVPLQNSVTLPDNLQFLVNQIRKGPPAGGKLRIPGHFRPRELIRKIDKIGKADADPYTLHVLGHIRGELERAPEKRGIYG